MQSRSEPGFPCRIDQLQDQARKGNMAILNGEEKLSKEEKAQAERTQTDKQRDGREIGRGLAYSGLGAE